MINIQIQPAEAFDMLSILEVKHSHASGDIKDNLRNQIEELQGRINAGISYEKAKQAYLSPHYTELYNANNDIFEGIDKLRAGHGDHGELQRLNDLRFQKKRDLQKVFFKSELNEIKF